MRYLEQWIGHRIDGSPTNPLQIVSSDEEVTIRQYVPQDAPAAFALIDRNREHLSQFGEATAMNYRKVKDFVKSIKSPSNKKRLRFGIWNAQSQLVGTINLSPRLERPDIGTVGYYLGEEFTGHDYTRRAVTALSQHAFNKMRYTQLEAHVHVDNGASAKVLHGAGFQLTEWSESRLSFTLDKQQ